jgi:signal transduction histidine kinase
MQTMELDEQIGRFDATVGSIERRVNELRAQSQDVDPATLRRLLSHVNELRAAERALIREHRELLEERDRLRVERAGYRDIFNSARDAYIITDLQGVVVEANLAAETMLAREVESPVGLSIGALIGDDGGGDAQARELIARVCSSGRVDDVPLRVGRAAAARDVLLAMCLLDGDRARIRWEFCARPEGSPRAGGAASAVETPPQHADAIRDEFLGLVSHELKTPIAVISGNAEVLARRDGQLAPEQRASALADIRGEAERLHRIVDNLLVLARLERGQQIGREPLELASVVSDVVAVHGLQWPARAFAIEVDEGLPPVDAARTYVAQALRNIITNAEQHNPPHEPIGLRAREIDGGVELSVLDRGPGVPDGEAELMFTPFYRSQAQPARTKGVGVGLAVARRLIEAQHGRIWAHSRFGGGMTVTLWLPERESLETAARHAAS